MSATNDKIIRVRAEISAAIADANRLKAAFAGIGQNSNLAGFTGNVGRAQGSANSLSGALRAANDNAGSLTGALNNAGNGASGLTGRLGGVSAALRSMGQSAAGALTSMSGLSSIMSSIGPLALAGGIGILASAFIGLAGAAVNAAATNETYKASLTTVLGSSALASQEFQRLAGFAAQTPFSLDQAVQGFIKLKALGLEPSQAAMTSYGNTASAMGKDLDQMVEAVADAATGEFERLKEFGIKAKTQGDQVSFTFQGVTTTIGNNSQEIQRYLQSIGEVQFAGAMERQSKTMQGAMASLSDSIQQTFAKMGEGGLLNGVTSIINGIANGITALEPVFTSLGSMMGDIFGSVMTIGSGIGDFFSQITGGGANSATIIQGLAEQFKIVGDVAAIIGNVIGGAFSVAGTVIGGVASFVRNAFSTVLEWLGFSTKSTTTSMGSSFLSTLGSIRNVTAAIPALFRIALNNSAQIFAAFGARIQRFFGGDWGAFGGLSGEIAGISARNRETAYNAINYRKGNLRAVAAPAATDTGAGGGGSPRAAGAGGSPRSGGGSAGSSENSAADRAKREQEFWQALTDQTTQAGLLAQEAARFTKERELQKILGRELLDTDRQRIATQLQSITQAKAETSLRQKLFEAQNEGHILAMRNPTLTGAQRDAEEEIARIRLSDLNNNVDITTAIYRQNEDALRNQLQQNAAVRERNKLLETATGFASRMSGGANARQQLADLDAQYQAWRSAVNSGQISGDFEAQIEAGYDAARLKIEQSGMDFVVRFSPTMDRMQRINTLNSDAEQARAQLSNMAIPDSLKERIAKEIEAGVGQGMARILAEGTEDWINAINGLADLFGGRFGGILKKFADGFDVIASMMRGDANSPVSFLSRFLGTPGTAEATAAQFSPENFGKAFSNPMRSLGDGFKDFKSMFSGDLATGITKGFTKMAAGAQVGGMVGGLGNMLGLGAGFEKGAQVGGTLGGLLGPVGSIIGSLGGGVIGKLLTKAKYGTASLTGAGEAEISGNKGAYKAAAKGAAGSVQEGLAKIASELGGEVGKFSLSIGQYKGKWRVSDDAMSGKMKMKKAGMNDFGDDQGAAIAYAIQNAIADGAITGLAPIIQKALGKLGTDSAIQFSKDWKAAMDGYQAMIDPITAAVKAVIAPLKTLRETMVSVGASTDDLTKIDEYRNLKLKAVLKDQLSTINDFLKSLSGEGSGITTLNLLNREIEEFKAMAERIKAGDKTVDQGEFTKLGQSIFSKGGEVWTTGTKEFQDILSMLKGATGGFITSVTDTFNQAAGMDAAVTAVDNTTAAIQAQTAAQQQYHASQVASNALMVDYLKQIVANQNNGAVIGGGGGGVSTNGKYHNQTY